jgi:mono/diheme cytochrome c family protein
VPGRELRKGAAALRFVTLLRIVVGALVVAACAPQQGLAPVERPAAAAFDPGLVARGAELSALGNCDICHTAPGGRPYAGGRSLQTPFGTFYGTNITPDETGIGRWSQAAFGRAMREGVDRDGRHLYPVFPYEYYTKLTDEDIGALYAYLMTREPVRASTPPHELRFPFNLRGLLGAWKALYLEPGAFQPDPRKSAHANRGAYLAEGLAHCGACHTPRSALGAELKDQRFTGGEAEGWHAPALDASNPAPVPWSAGQLFTYLRTGLDELHAIAAGPMDPVVRNLARVNEADVRALADHFAALAGPPSPERRQRAAASLAQAKRDRAAPLNDGSIYAGACGICHDRGRDASSGSGLHLALSTALTVPTSRNLVRITLEGIAPPEGEPGRSMPGFARSLTDAQVTALMHYSRARFGGGAPPWTDVEQALREAREAK